MQAPTQENAADVARESRVLAQSLKETFKKNDVLNKDVEFKRKSLRKQQLKLLLLYATSKDAKDAETHLWMQTSYQCIAAYKQRIAVLDRKLFGPPPQQQQNQNRDRDRDRERDRDRSGGGGHVEYRKLLMRFRQFLAEEERFYTQLLVRFCKQFVLGEAARGALVRAEILQVQTAAPPPNGVPAVPTSPLSPISGDSENAEQENERDPLDDVPLPRAESERNLFPETRETPPQSERERELRLTVFTKLLVCLGDIARYREQYNDGGGRPRAGHEEGAPRRARRGGGRGANSANANSPGLARPRNYQRAQTIYEQARILRPDDGNASHQLAILAAYKHDSFVTVLHYYRALCVRHPYDTASDNLNVVLKKALDQYRAAKSANVGKEKEEKVMKSPKLRSDRFKEWVVVLHALWYLDSDSNVAKASKQARLVIDEYKIMLEDRLLQTSEVLDVFILSLAAHWKLRMIRDKKVRADVTIITPHVAAHVLNIARTLLVLGTAQLAEARGEDAHGGVRVDDSLGDDLAQRITAAFRRTVPALRIMSKWVRSSIGYLYAEAGRASSSSAALQPTTSEPLLAARSQLKQSLDAFWSAYAVFMSALTEAFPEARLPSLRGPLEEDISVAGFSPIKRALVQPPAVSLSGLAPGQEEVHPNEEYLMRIHDLLSDAGAVASDEKTPVAFEDGRYTFVQVQRALLPEPPVAESRLASDADNGVGPSNTIPHLHPQATTNGDVQTGIKLGAMEERVHNASPRPPIANDFVGEDQDDKEEGDDDSMTQATRTDDDVIREAFDTALDVNGTAGADDVEEDDDEDRIIWSPPKDYKLLNQSHNIGLGDTDRQRVLPSATSAPFEQPYPHSPISFGPSMTLAGDRQQLQPIQQMHPQNQSIPNPIGFSNTGQIMETTAANFRNLSPHISPRDRTTFVQQQEQQTSLLPNQRFATSPTLVVPPSGNTTAQDLLNNVLGFSSRTSRSAAPNTAVAAAASSPAFGGPAFTLGLSPVQRARHISMSAGAPGSPMSALPGMAQHQHQQLQQQQQASIPLKSSKMQTGSIWSSTNMELGESATADIQVGGIGIGAGAGGIGSNGLIGMGTAVVPPPMRSAASGSGSGSTHSLMPPMSMQGTVFPSAPDLSPYSQKTSLAPGHGRSLSGSGLGSGVGVGVGVGMSTGSSLGLNSAFRAGEGTGIGVGGSTRGQQNLNSFGAIGQMQPHLTLQERHNLNLQQQQGSLQRSFDPLLLQQQHQQQHHQAGLGHGLGHRPGLGSRSGSVSISGIGSESALPQQVLYDTRLGGGIAATSIGAEKRSSNGHNSGGYNLGVGIGIGNGLGNNDATGYRSPTHLQNNATHLHGRDYGIGNGTAGLGSAGTIISGGPASASVTATATNTNAGSSIFGNINGNAGGTSIGDLSARAQLYGSGMGGGEYDARGAGVGVGIGMGMGMGMGGDGAFGMGYASGGGGSGGGPGPGSVLGQGVGYGQEAYGLPIGGSAVNVGNPTMGMGMGIGIGMTAARNGVAADAYRRSLWER